MLIHYIWIGSNTIPQEYLFNLEKCKQLNPTYEFKIWRDEDCVNLLDDYDYWFSLPTLISKTGYLRYLILDKFGGTYSDFDIEWKVPFNVILNEHKTNNKLLLTVNPFASTIIDNKNIYLLDDPFIYSEPNILGECIQYCKNRVELKKDGDWYLKTGKLRQHLLEPIGPFGLTEWVYYNNIDIDFFSQVGFIDQFKGKYGIHKQQTNWK